ncbi:MAG: DUF1330 domain-containing protein [Elioraea sp.]|nr:DUF1330 domain-containing protein [Elioraea sp.]MCX7960922.1 DUF1330 domain-containing protein [Burkholderiales bacterium]
MAAYVIAQVDVKDEALFEEYRRQVPETVARYGGRYLVRGGALESLEGGWAPRRLVVLEFPSVEAARRWYRSPEYAPLLAMRLKAAETKALIVEGV